MDLHGKTMEIHHLLLRVSNALAQRESHTEQGKL